MNLTRVNAFSILLSITYLAPIAIPGIGLDYQYFFVVVLVLLAYFTFKWNSIKEITSKGTHPEVILGLAVISADYGENFIRASNVGIIDLLVILLANVTIFYGIKSLRKFWLPVAYGVVLLLGYQLEAVIPNFVALQDWLASIMAGSMNVLGIAASADGQIVTLLTPNGTLSLDVASSCTGVQGILAFGLLSTMALMDLKPNLIKSIPIFAVGFIGAFLINIVRLVVIFLTFVYLGVDNGEIMHVYFGYIVFVIWVMIFWAFAFRILVVKPTQVTASASLAFSTVKSWTNTLRSSKEGISQKHLR